MDEKNQQNIEKEVIKFISERLGIAPETINSNSHLFDDLNASKIELADIIQTLEERYQIKFDLEAIPSLETIGNIVEYIKDNVD